MHSRASSSRGDKFEERSLDATKSTNNLKYLMHSLPQKDRISNNRSWFCGRFKCYESDADSLVLLAGEGLPNSHSKYMMYARNARAMCLLLFCRMFFLEQLLVMQLLSKYQYSLRQAIYSNIIVQQVGATSTTMIIIADRGKYNILAFWFAGSAFKQCVCKYCLRRTYLVLLLQGCTSRSPTGQIIIEINGEVKFIHI